VHTLVAALSIVMMKGAVSAQIIDRVLAVVGGEPITLSDVTAAIRLGLVPAPQAKEDPTRAALNSLIERQLQIVEVNRYLPPEPTEAEIESRLAQIRARFQQDAFDAVLAETGVTLAQLRARVRDNLRIETYLLQRFGAGYQPSEEEVLRFYLASDFARNGAARPYAEVREEVRRRLIEERKAALIKDWIAGLRRRADITILP
jgi:SurA N-terminal domain